MASETTPAIRLRQQVVSEVVRALIVLAIGELVIIALLIATHTPIPGELWLAFGGSTTGLTALLVNTKSDSPPSLEPAPVEIVQDTPVEVDQVDTPKPKR